MNVLLVARVLGPEGRGEVTFLMTVAGLTAFAFNLSVQEANGNLAGLREDRAGSLATNSLALSIVLGCAAAVVAVAALAYAPFLEADVPDDDLALALASIPFLILQIYLVYLARGVYAFGAANAGLLTAPVVTLIANVVMALGDALTVTSALAAWTAGNALSVVLLLGHAGVKLGFGRADRRLAGEAIALGSKAHLGGVLATGSYRLDQWILGAVAGPRELGLYSVAVAWFEGLFLLPTAISAVARPDLVRATMHEAGRLAATLFRATALVTGALAVVMVLAAPILCSVVFGEEFADAAISLRLLAAGSIGIVGLKVVGNALTAQQRPLLESAAMGAGFAVAIVLYITLIPSLESAGAAIASTVAYTVSGAVAAWFLVRRLDVPAKDLVPRPRDVQALAALVRGRGLAAERP